MKFAVIETGGKQHKVSVGDELKVEKLAAGDKIVFDKVILLDDGETTTLGTPYIEGAKVEAKFAGAGRGRKITVIRYKAKSRYFKKKGHRQPYTRVKITKC